MPLRTCFFITISDNNWVWSSLYYREDFFANTTNIGWGDNIQKPSTRVVAHSRKRSPGWLAWWCLPWCNVPIENWTGSFVYGGTV